MATPFGDVVIKTGVFSISIGVLSSLLMLSRLIFPNVIKSSGNIKSLPKRTQTIPIFSPSLLASHTWMSFFMAAYTTEWTDLWDFTRNRLLLLHG